MTSKGTFCATALSNHQRVPALSPPSARCSATFVPEETALAAFAPEVIRPASCDQLAVEPSGQSIPPLISLPICTMSAVVPWALRAFSTS